MHVFSEHRVKEMSIVAVGGSVLPLVGSNVGITDGPSVGMVVGFSVGSGDGCGEGSR